MRASSNMSMANKAPHADASIDMLAGYAVADGAVHAGPLAKRSDWLHSWNERLAILSTESLTWQRILEGTPVDQRAVLLHSGIRLSVREGTRSWQAKRA